MRSYLKGLPPLIAILMALGILSGLIAVSKRVRVEARNRQVELALEWEEVERLAHVTQTPLPLLLERFREVGVHTLAVTEETLGAQEQLGAIQIEQTDFHLATPSVRVTVHSPALWERIQAALARRHFPVQSGLSPSAPNPLGTTVFVLSAPQQIAPNSPGTSLTVPVSFAALRSLGIGLPPEAVKAAQEARWEIAGRITNFAGVNPMTAQVVLTDLRKQGASTVIFQGDEVLGYRGLEKTVADMFRAKPLPPQEQKPDTLPPVGLAYGAVEFSKQKGDAPLTAALRGDYVRVHSIQVAEMAQLDEGEVIDRFVKAVKERNIRLCYVRLFTFAGADPLAENLDLLRRIRAGMERNSGLLGGRITFGKAQRFDETGLFSLLFLLAGLGTAAGTVWLVRTLCPLPQRSERLLLLGGCLLCGGLSVMGESGRKLVALLAGVVYPAVACLLVMQRLTEQESGSSASRRAVLLGAIHAILAASVVTGVGILHVVGLLSTRPFMLKTTQYLGIKAQHALPLLIVAFAALVGGGRLSGETWKRWRGRVTERLQSLWEEPARIGLLLMTLVALAGLFLIIARTGNDAGAGVSGVELKARAVLDRVLPVRPRTKEFLIGHPAFVLAVAWWLGGRKRLALPTFVVGSIGQVSLLNTFCHLHTPLLVSLWRDILGLVVGIGIGFLLYRLLERMLPPPQEARR